PGPPAAARAPARPRWRDLVAAYRLTKGKRGYLAKRPKTRTEYDSRIRTLDAWALDGELRLDQLDRQMVLDLKEALEQGSKYRCAALLRVLGILLQLAYNKGWIASNFAHKLDIETPPRRKRRILREHLPHLVEAAAELAMPHVELGILLGFYTMQREGDLLAATGFQIRPIDDVSTDARKALTGQDGKVSGLWLQQAKTETWVAVALAPWARAPVEAAIAAGRAAGAACTHLILHPAEDRPCPDWRFQRDFRAVVSHAAAAAALRQDHDLARILGGDPGKPRDAIQYRDLRRSGMCWLRELRVPTPLIASISGHSIRETEDILETYMPRDTRAAAEGMAIAVARQAERDLAERLEQDPGSRSGTGGQG
ncbi:MAG TPA: hypothetical protein VGW34_07965, partial [Allosphingosinicella sp.]|nr:hypothetical protein [Allosphingosinicella sp.]